MAIWAFLPPRDEADRRLLANSLKEGKSRFGWSTEQANDLRQRENHWTDANRKQMFLLRIGEGDWIVHVNLPVHNQCIAAKVTSAYGFDGGIESSQGADFRHFFKVEADGLVEFSRRDPAVIPAVNLTPRQRYHQIYAVDAFHETLNNLRQNKTVSLPSQTEPVLERLTQQIHEHNRGKTLESYLAKVFRRVPGVVEVVEHGQGWGTDHGADLVVYYGPPLPRVTLVVQVKSYEGSMTEVLAVDQIKTAITKFGAHSGMIVTTAAEVGPQVEGAIADAAEELGVPIELLASADVARLVIRYAPDLLFSVT